MRRWPSIAGVGGSGKLTDAIKVRIPLVINRKGQWNACGWSDTPEEELLETVVGNFDAEPSLPEAIYWIEALIPVPQAETIVGVVRAESDDA